jgi:hypothetical protein
MYGLILALLAFALVAPAHGQVHVDIGIHLPAPPSLIIVPQVPTVKYVPAPAAPGNLFFYNGQYWAFANRGWYVSTGYNGPWLVVAPQYVPRPILLVPVGRYHVPPGHWKQWRREQPPHWDDEWGHDWAKKRAWKGRDQGHDRRRAEGDGRGEGHPGKGRDRADDHGRGEGEAHGGGRSHGHGGGR